MHKSANQTLLLMVLFFIYNQPLKSQPTIILNTALSAPISNETQTGFADSVVSEAFERIGYKLVVVHLPAERALINANKGIDDGDLIRIAGLQKKYTNLIQVPEVIMQLNMVLFSKKINHKINDWSSINSYSLAIISGWKIFEENFGRYADKIDIIKTDDESQAFSLLLNNRVDFFSYSQWAGLYYLKKNNISNIKMLNKPLASPKLYIYLHKKHKSIIQNLASELKKMKIDGTYKKIYNEKLLPLFN